MKQHQLYMCMWSMMNVYQIRSLDHATLVLNQIEWNFEENELDKTGFRCGIESIELQNQFSRSWKSIEIGQMCINTSTASLRIYRTWISA